MPSKTEEKSALARRLASSMKLVETTCCLSAEHELDNVLQAVTESVCEALNCERASLYLYDTDRDELYTQVVTELEIESIRFSTDMGVAGWVARRRKTAVITEPHRDTRWDPTTDEKTGFQTRNILATPLITSHDDRLVGVLQLINKRRRCFDSFDEQLVQAFAAHAAAALERSRLMDEAKRSHEMNVEFEMGRQIQSSFLPNELPQIPGYEVAAWWQPAEAVSGDYYDLVELCDGRLGLVVADVSGHGVGPSLIMASARAMLHVLTRRRADPEQILSLLAETIAPDLQQGLFITFLMVALDPRSHRLTFANAGHAPAVLYRREERVFTELTSTTLPMGFTQNHDVPLGDTIEMNVGDLLVLATDGTIEVKNNEGEMYGIRRLEQLIDENRDLPAGDLMAVIQSAINGFHSDDLPPDDVTVMVLERKLST